jgi:hypothetical protein
VNRYERILVFVVVFLLSAFTVGLWDSYNKARQYSEHLARELRLCEEGKEKR